MNKIYNITCPACNHRFDVEDVLAAEIQKKLRSEFEQKRKEWESELKQRSDQLEEQKKVFEERKRKENELFENKLKERLLIEKQTIEKSVSEDFRSQLESSKAELEKKQKQLTELRAKELELERMKVMMQEQEQEIELKYQKKMSTELLEREEKISRRVQEANELKLKEKDKQLEDHKKLIEELKRKSEQGSGQLRGEVQELAIEEYLCEQFPLDTIEEIKKGARGADCIQIINTRNHSGCGKIYYESKRTKDFQPHWIEKFRADIRQEGADLGVLVTSALPKDMERMGLKKGIWICTHEEFKALCHVLRQSIIKLSEVRSAHTNRGDKMEMLYNYLTSNEFRLMIEGIVEGFTQMKQDLDKEKAAMQRIWNQREKQIEKVLLNTTGMYGSIKGIAGNAIANIQALELPGE